MALLAKTYLKETVETYTFYPPKLADWIEVNISEGFSALSFNQSRQRRIRSTNYLKWLNREIKWTHLRDTDFYKCGSILAVDYS